MIAGEEKTTDGKEQLIDQRFRTFRNYASELGVYHAKYTYIGDFLSKNGHTG